jgi:hypothetical protein
MGRLVKRKPIPEEEDFVGGEIDIPSVRGNLTIWRNGGEGFIKWCNDFCVRIPIFEFGQPIWKPIPELSTVLHPVTKRSAKMMWDEQCNIIREALRMEDGIFIYRLIVFCWMRGESKSLLACLIVVWKFFCFASQKFMLGANSKDQSRFVHYDIIRDIILNTPQLLAIVGERNIQEKEIRLKNIKGRTVSIIRSVSSFSGILSNITGYTFSEMFDMKNPKFFTQIDGSIRNVPNAFGLIDSTVSNKQHILYQLYESWKNGKDPSIFFSHRQSIKADYKDYWNPEMTQAQLDSYSYKFPLAEFAQYFKNTWEAGSDRLFTDAMVKAMRYIGYGNSLGENAKIQSILMDCERIENNENIGKDQKLSLIKNLKAPFIRISKAYSLKTEYLQPRCIKMSELEYLSDLYDTDWAIIAGADRADPMKKDIEFGARTILSFVAKGLPGSRTSPRQSVSDSQSTKYIYFLIYLVHVIHSDLPSIKEFLEEVDDDLGGISSFCTERWGMWDMGEWCEERQILFEAVTPSYVKQKEGFSELFTLVKDGRFKAPPLAVQGSKWPDILVEEASIFDHNKAKKLYGSPEKGERRGIQDDSMFSIGWAVYGGRLLTVDDFISRNVHTSFGEFYKGDKLVGRY